MSLRFSKEYREYLAVLGLASVYGHEFTGICASPRLNVVDATISEKTQDPSIPADWYVIEQANIDNIIIWQLGTGEVYQTTPNFPPIKLCESLCEYLNL